jgi:hypothetical protein
MEVHYEDTEGKTQKQTCSDIKEGDTGLHIFDANGRNQTGYIPYERLYYVLPEKP